MAERDRTDTAAGEGEAGGPRFHAGERARHRTAGVCFVYGYVRRGGRWLYDLYPSVLGGDVRVDGHWYWLDDALSAFPASEDESA